LPNLKACWQGFLAEILGPSERLEEARFDELGQPKTGRVASPWPVMNEAKSVCAPAHFFAPPPGRRAHRIRLHDGPFFALAVHAF
jgi:hypothetical protein